MQSPVFTYPVLIKENHLDTFGHVNNAAYLTLFEEARWELITRNGYGLVKIMQCGIGPTLLDVNLRFLKEIRLRDEIVIESQVHSYEKKIGTIGHRILRGDEVCCTAVFTIGLMNLARRKLILPTPEWLRALGMETA